MKLAKSLLLVLLFGILLAACGAAGDSGASESDSAMNYASFLSYLQEAGFQVEETGVVSQPFTTTEAKTLTINSGEMQVFEFADQPTAEAQISAFQEYFDTSMVMWIAPPHFYQTGRIIILYLGDNAEIIQAMESIAGGQFAGQ